MKTLMLLSAFYLIQCSSSFAAVFGTDNRRPITSHTGSIQSNQAKAVAIMLPNTALVAKSAGLIDLEVFPLTFNHDLCAEEKLAKNVGFPSACSGFLIADDVVLTAGHCVLSIGGKAKNEKTSMCNDFSWYFDFEADAGREPKTAGISKNEIYRCQEVIEAQFDIPRTSPVTPSDIGLDYALIKLDHKVKSRVPLKLTGKRPVPREMLTMIGHPLHTVKMASAGHQVGDEKNYVNMTIDSFNGNSGSPVFNSKNEVFGILVRGYPSDLIWDEKRQCNRTNHCKNEGESCEKMDSEDVVPPGDHAMPLGLIEALKPYLK